MDCMDSSRDHYMDYNRGHRVQEVAVRRNQRDHIQVELVVVPEGVVVVVVFFQPGGKK